LARKKAEDEAKEAAEAERLAKQKQFEAEKEKKRLIEETKLA